MLVYLAGNPGRPPWEMQKFYDFHRLDSYLQVQKKDAQHTRFKSFVLDSGVFSFLNGRSVKEIDWYEYADGYADYVRKYQIQNYVELDLDTYLGLPAVEELRARLEKRVGWQSMPVWHMNRGYDKWLEVCRSHRYVCFGAFLTDNLPRSKYPGIKRFLDDAKREGCRVHGLGFTSFDWLPRLPFYSVDSSSWLAGNRFGSVCMFTGTRIKTVMRPPGTRIFDQDGLGWHNLSEWIKFQQYAEISL